MKIIKEVRQPHGCTAELATIAEDLWLGSIVECSCGQQYIRRDQRDGPYWAPHNADDKPEVAHGYTGHGHTCCKKATHERPAHIQAIARCGGPGMCQQCADDRDEIHAGRQKP